MAIIELSAYRESRIDLIRATIKAITLTDNGLTRDDCENVVDKIIQKFNIQIQASEHDSIYASVIPTIPPTVTSHELAQRIYGMSQLSDGISSYLKIQTSPMQCVDVMQLLAISDEGFLKSSGESTFVALCPSGTVWNDLRKACVWSDMQSVVGTSFADQSQQQVMVNNHTINNAL